MHSRACSRSQDDHWLLRSPTTKEFDLLDVDGEWQIWLGRIEKSHLEISCSVCNDDADCNLNGACNREGRCDCKIEGGTKFLGTHCEVKLEDDACGTITSEINDVVYSIQYFPPDGSDLSGKLFQQYNRPVYAHIRGMPGIKEGDLHWLVYTGRKWFGIKVNFLEMNATLGQLAMRSANFHGAYFY
jgi:hypothetical protein